MMFRVALTNIDTLLLFYSIYIQQTMVKKKPFIDKKSASVYHVVRRSQRDVGTEATSETLSDFVLMPSPDNNDNRQNKTTNANVVTESISREEYNDIKRNPKSNKKNLDFTTIKNHIQKTNLHDTQSTTYSQYTKPISSSGTFLSSNILHEEDASNLSKLFTDNTNNELDTALTEAMAVHEADRMLDSIALTTDCLDDDIEEALFNYNEDEFEEILDDFCFTANLEVLDTDNTDNDEEGGEFNYEQHIQQLMEKARKLDAGEYDNGGRAMDEEEANFFGGVLPLHGRIEEEDVEDDNFNYDQYGEEEEEDSLDREFNGQDEEDNGNNNTASAAAAKLGDEEQRILCQKFEEALLEYDPDDLGDLDEECEEIVGDRPLEGDFQLEAALDEFLTDNQDDILIEGDKALMRGIPKHINKRTGGSGYSALVGTKMVNADQLQQEKDTLLINIEESKKQMQKDLADADAILANPEVDLPPEEVFIDGKSYFTETSRSQWDCESILSTYSNLDNNPVVIGRKKKKKKKGKKMMKNENVSGDVIPEDGPVKIQLSSKTGLPLGIFNNIDEQSPEQDDDDYYYNDESETYISINRGEARDKSETKLEKKQRKVAIKEERKICRMQKKIMKEAFKEEFMKRGQDVIDNDVGGSTVFRF